MKDDDIYRTDIPVGDVLRRTRLHYNQSLNDVERVLRIRATQLDALEKGEYDKLPGRVYVIGFIRSYSEYLGLDGDQMIRLFKSQGGVKARAPELHFPVSASDSKTPNLKIVLASLACAGLLIWVWAGSGGSETKEAVNEIPALEQNETAQYGPSLPENHPLAVRAAPQAASVPVSASVSETSATAPLPQTDTQPAPAQPESQGGIILNIVQNSWVEIKDQNGQAVVSRVLKAGDIYYVPDRPDLRMSLGNAAGVQITVDGESLRPLGESGQVRRNIPLDAKILRERFAKPN